MKIIRNGETIELTPAELTQAYDEKEREYRHEDILSKLESEESGMAFQGPSIRGALANFVEGVRSSALSYLNKLKAAEQQIVASVFETYAAQDEDISSNLASDTSKLNS